MKKTIISLGVILAIAIACQVNEPETTPETPGATSEAAVLDEIFTVAEKPTAFPGGKEAWANFIQENLIIPESNPQGKVFATFVVDKEGALHDIQLIRGIGKGADEAVLALLNKSPKWEVAEQRGRKVNMRMQVAIQFGEAEKDLTPAPPKPGIEDMNAGFDQVFMVVEEQAVFPGGKQAWADYIKDNLKTPDSNVKGKVFATFIVDKQGGLNNIQLVRGIGGGADEAVLELLQNSPNWEAGKQRGREVNSRMQVAINFEQTVHLKTHKTMKKYLALLILALAFSCQENAELKPEATIDEAETAIADIEIVEIPYQEIEVALDVIKETVLLEVEADQSTVEKEIPIEIIIEEIPDTEVILEENPRKH